MKYIKTLLFVLVFLFVGCTQKTVAPSPTSKSYDSNKETAVIMEDTTKQEVVLFQKELPKEEIITNNTIAIVYPSMSIGKYALEATNSINTYLLYKNSPFHTETFDIVVESKKNIIDLFAQLKKSNITKVIALITREQIDVLNTISGLEDMKIYLPLIEKYELKDIKNFKYTNIVFGAISYEKQFQKLLNYAQNSSLVELYDNTQMGIFLHNYLKKEKLAYSKMVDDNNGRYHYFLKDNSAIDNSTIILNTPIVKSSILLSTITAHELKPSRVLSTQLNYTPLIFSLTQTADRKGLIVANSIGELPLDLIEFNELLGNDLSYNWVNYSSIVGAQWLTSNDIGFFKELKLVENQVIYPVKLYEVTNSSFKFLY